MPNLVCVSPECTNALPKGKENIVLTHASGKNKKEYIEQTNLIVNINLKKNQLTKHK